MRYDWMLLARTTLNPLAKGTHRCSSAARLARWLRKHKGGPKTVGSVLWYRRKDRNGQPIETWQTRALAAR